METEEEVENENERRSPIEGVFKYFGILMPLMYVAFGLGFIFNPNDIFHNVPQKYAVPTGVLLMLYGGYRGYRIVKNAMAK